MTPTEPHWMPLWARRLQIMSYLAFVPWFALILFGDPFKYPALMLTIIAAIGIPAIVRSYFMMGAAMRGEINLFTGRKRRRD